MSQDYAKKLEALGVKVQGKQAEVPTGGEFQPQGFVGPLMAGMFWTFSSQDNYVTYNAQVDEENKVPRPQYLEPMGQWGHRYYYVSRADAQKGVEEIGSRNNDGDLIGIQMRWHLELKRDMILNWSSDENRLKWPEQMKNDVQVKTTASKKYRHEYQQIALPAAVQAVALYLGMLDKPVFSFDELLDRNTVFDDAFFAEYFGDPTGKKEDREEFQSFVDELVSREGVTKEAAVRQIRSQGLAKTPYQHSVYWERRDALWNALGEKDAEACLPIARNEDGTIAKDQPKKATSSEQLDYCIKFATSQWERPVWARVMYANNPSPGETFTTGDSDTERRRNIAIIWEIFDDEASAQATVESEKDAAENGASEVAKPAVVSLPSVPAAWAGVGFTVDQFAAQIKTKEGVAAAEVASEFNCTVDEVEAFRKYLATQ